MSDWQIGDLALCVRTLRKKTGAATEVRAGMAFQVVAVIPAVLWVNSGRIDDALTLAGVNHGNPCGGSWQGNFVKVTPPAADEFDREAIELMNRNPVGEPVQ